MKGVFVHYQNQPNCHRWHLFGLEFGGNLFASYFCLLWWSLRGERVPPTQLPLVPGIGHTKAQCDGVITVAAQSCRMCQHVIDSSVWLPCPTLLKSQCSQTIHQNLNKKHVYKQKKVDWLQENPSKGCKLKEAPFQHLRTTFAVGFCSVCIWVAGLVRNTVDLHGSLWLQTRWLTFEWAGGGSLWWGLCFRGGWAKESGHTACPVSWAHGLP